MLKNLPLMLTLSLGMVSTAQFSFAEISGSGHRYPGCDAKIEATHFRDNNLNGIMDGVDQPLANIDVSITRTSAPELGTDTLTTDSSGRVLFFNLCTDLYAVDIDLQTLPAAVQLNAVVDDIPEFDVWDGNPTASQLLVPFEPTETTAHRHVQLAYIDSGCSLGVTANCFVSGDSIAPSTPDYECKVPIEELSLLWAGEENIRVVAHKGDLNAPVIADIDYVVPGTIVQVDGYTGSPDDVIWELYYAGTDNKMGESAFHLSCSDTDMDDPGDCGKMAGDGTNNAMCTGGDGACLNSWLFEGWVDKEGAISCSGYYPTTPLLDGTLSCESDGPNEINFQYSLVNNSPHNIDIVDVNDSVLGTLPDLPTQTLNSGEAYTFTYADHVAATEIRQLSVTSFNHDTGQTCSTATDVETTVNPSANRCENIEVAMKRMRSNFLQLEILNSTDMDMTLRGIELEWPAENRGLRELKIGNSRLIHTVIPWTPGVERVEEDLFERDSDDRSILMGQTHSYKFKFQRHARNSPQSYGVRFDFGDDCSVQFRN